MEGLSKEQKAAIRKLNAALKNAHKQGIWLAVMDHDLLYSTKKNMDKYSDITKDRYNGSYCPVAQSYQANDEGSGRLYSENFDDSGGW